MQFHCQVVVEDRGWVDLEPSGQYCPWLSDPQNWTPLSSTFSTTCLIWWNTLRFSVFVHFSIDKRFDFCLIMFLEIELDLLFFLFSWWQVIDTQYAHFAAGALTAFSKTFVACPSNEPCKLAGQLLSVCLSAISNNIKTQKLHTWHCLINQRAAFILFFCSRITCSHRESWSYVSEFMAVECWASYQ